MKAQYSDQFLKEHEHRVQLAVELGNVSHLIALALRKMVSHRDEPFQNLVRSLWGNVVKEINVLFEMPIRNSTESIWYYDICRTTLERLDNLLSTCNSENALTKAEWEICDKIIQKNLNWLRSH